MRTSQTLSLIGCIFGMLLTIGLLLTMSFPGWDSKRTYEQV